MGLPSRVVTLGCIIAFGNACGVSFTPPPGAANVDPTKQPDAKPVDTPPPVQAKPCTEGTRQLVDGTRCYTFFAAATRANAKTQCTNIGAHLAAITTQDELTKVAAFAQLPQNNGRVWLGGEYMANAWKWDSGDPWTVANGDNAWWQGGEPNNLPRENCLVLDTEGAGGKWDNIECADGRTYAFICERGM